MLTAAMTTSSKSGKLHQIMPFHLRVVSYNILSSHLADPAHFSKLNPEHLHAEKRLPVIMEKLDEEIQKNAVICLQEVSHDWAGKLHTHFANHGYHLVTGLYGKKFNGYMGVALAWPTQSFSCIDVDICRLSDTREDGWPRNPNEPGIITKTIDKVKSFTRPSLEKFGLVSRPPVDFWNMSENRWNNLLSAKLEDKETGKAFSLSTYHMPCAFYAPKVMSIHCELAAKHAQAVAGDLPCVLAGDWNIKPASSSYQLITTGTLDPLDPEFPDSKWGMTWTPTAKAMRSAYASASTDNQEPDFTNYAQVRDNEPFIDTLDYIFLSEEWKVSSVKELPKREVSGGPFPNLDRKEPSDHLLIAADLMLD